MKSLHVAITIVLTLGASMIASAGADPLAKEPVAPKEPIGPKLPGGAFPGDPAQPSDPAPAPIVKNGVLVGVLTLENLRPRALAP